MNPIRKIITILLLSLFLFGYHTCEHMGPDMYGQTYGNSNTTIGKQYCFYQGEYTQGMNKVCQYSCTGSGHAITRSAVSICPMGVYK